MKLTERQATVALAALLIGAVIVGVLIWALGLPQP
jgi:hypothetical protein